MSASVAVSPSALKSALRRRHRFISYHWKMIQRIVIALLLLLTACGRKPASATAPDQTYTLRAQVTGLPIPPKAGLRLHHEAIPNFVGADGRVEGMDEMEMEFPYLGPQVHLEGIALDDLVQAQLEIRWKGEPRYLLTSIHKL